MNDEEALDAFEETSPEQLEARELQRRVDRRYLLPLARLGELLTDLHAGYQIVRSGNTRMAQYDTLYFRYGRTPDVRRSPARPGTTLQGAPQASPRSAAELPRNQVQTRLAHEQGANEPAVWRHRTRQGRLAIHRESLPDLSSTPASLCVGCLPESDVGRRNNRRARHSRLGHLLSRSLTARCLPRAGHRGDQAAALFEHEPRHPRDSGPAPARGGLSRYCLATATLAPVRANVFKPMLTAMEHPA